MSFLIDAYRQKAGKEKDKRLSEEAGSDVAYSTGFLALDFLNGTIVHVKNEEKDYKYYSCGLADGSIVMVIGRSGCGKTTFVEQMAANIVRPFENGVIYEDNIEGGIIESRRVELSGFTPDEIKDRYVVRNSGISNETVFQRIRMIYDLKTENRESLEYDTGLEDIHGNRIYKLVPTVYILDSLAMLSPDNILEDDELGTSMSQTASAKSNSVLFKGITPMLKSANIILLVINHIQEEVSINPMQRKKAQLAFLKQGESLPGGKKPVYLSNNVIRLDDATKLKADEAFKIDSGNITMVTLLKSRSNMSGKSVPLIFNPIIGYDPILSLFYFLKNEGGLKGAGAYLYIDGVPEIKFSQATFKEKYINDPVLRDAFHKAVVPYLKKLVPEVNEESRTIEQTLTNDIMNIANNL